MSTPAEKLAEALKALHKLQQSGLIGIKTDQISKTHRRRLVQQGFLKEVTRGWYIATRPDEGAGDSTSWYTSYWEFCKQFIDEKHGDEWIISPDQSLQLHAGNWTVPHQLMIKSPNASNFNTDLLYQTSIFFMRGELPENELRTTERELQLYTLPAALVYCSQNFYTQDPTDARAALAMIRDSSEVLNVLLSKGHSTIAGRLAGAFRNIGRDRIAEDILKTMKSAGYDVRESDPFQDHTAVELSFRERSPYSNRIRLLWSTMRAEIIKVFPAAPGLPEQHKEYLKMVEDIYVTDAYHSLSIERYKVTPELIERVRSGKWDVVGSEEDKKQKDAMAARGYWQAFLKVKKSITRILEGANAGAVADKDHSDWYRELFAPSVAAGLLKPSDLAGYRNNQVFIGGSKHVPLSVEAMREVMPLLFELLENEPEASVRAVLGHFIFVYIHPYMDGNGRTGRFLMNVMLSSGGYPWTVIPVERRTEYMSALEKGSVESDIRPLAKFIAELVSLTLKGKPVASI